MFSFRKLYHKFFNEGSYVLVAYNFAFPLLNTENLFRNLNLHIFLNLNLATQTPLSLLLLAGKESCFCRENLPAAFSYAAFAHSTGSATATCRGEENFLIAECA